MHQNNQQYILESGALCTLMFIRFWDAWMILKAGKSQTYFLYENYQNFFQSESENILFQIPRPLGKVVGLDFTEYAFGFQKIFFEKLFE